MTFVDFLKKNKFSIIGIFVLVIIVLLILSIPKDTSNMEATQQEGGEKNKLTNSLVILANSLNTVSQTDEPNLTIPGVGQPTDSTRKLTTDELMEKGRSIITQWWTTFLSVVPNDMKYSLAACTNVTDMNILQNTMICLVTNLLKRYAVTTQTLTEEDVLKIYKDKEQSDVLGSIILNFLISQMITKGFNSDTRDDGTIVFKIKDANFSDPKYSEIPYSVILELFKSENKIKIYGSLKEETQTILDELRQKPGSENFKQIFKDLDVNNKIYISLFAKFVIYIWLVKFPELDDHCVYCSYQ